MQRSDRAIYEHLCKAKQDFLMPLLQLETQLASQLANDSTPVAEHIAWLEERLGELGLANDEKVCLLPVPCTSSDWHIRLVYHLMELLSLATPTIPVFRSKMTKPCCKHPIFVSK
jgi:hypothetical protein